MLGRPRVDEVLLAVFAIVVLIVVQLGDDGDDTAEVTATPTPSAAVPAASTPTAASPSAEEAASLAAPTPTVSETGTPAAPTPTVDAAATPTATLAAAASTPDPDSCDFRDELERVRGAVVRIRAPESPYSGSQGTGFHIGGGEFVTAAHVVQNERGEAHDEIYVASALTGRTERAEVVRAGSFSTSTDRQHRDIAILRSALVVDHVVAYRSPGQTDVGQVVRALGYPWSQAEDESTAIPPPVVLRGTLSNTAVRDNVAVVQSDVRAQSGMSGGPLVDECGFVLAVASAVPRARRGEVGDGLTVFVSMAELAKLR
ncbi:MAG: serine protease [Chloroflexota bacterium]|nr:serine protease [Chloroflexota bacterium]